MSTRVKHPKTGEDLGTLLSRKGEFFIQEHMEWGKFRNAEEAGRALAYAQDAHVLIPYGAGVPKLHSEQDDVLRLRWFLPDSGWTWYVKEATAYMDDGGEVPLGVLNLDQYPNFPMVEDIHCFGYVVSGLDPMFSEWGTFSFREISSVRSPRFGLRVERDLYFTPKDRREVSEIG